MNKMTTLYMTRHGRTEWNEKGIIQGHSDSNLTQEGMDQAKALAAKFKDIKFDYIFSSDLGRAMKTAEIINLEHKLTIKATELLRERTYGHIEGTPSFNFKDWDNAIKNLSDKEHYNFKFEENTESDKEIVERFMTFMREISIIMPGKVILVVTHGGFMRAVLVWLGIGTYKQMEHGAVTNTAFARIETDGTDFFIKEHEGIKFSN